MKRDMLFTAERLAVTLDERRMAILLRLHSVGKANGTADAPAKLFASFLRKADEGTLGRVLVEVAVLQSAHPRPNPPKPSTKPPSSTRWTWPRSRPKSSRSLRRKTRPGKRRRPRPNQHPKPPRRPLPHNRQPRQTSSRSQQHRLRIFAARSPSTRPHSRSRHGGRSFLPARRA